MQKKKVGGRSRRKPTIHHSIKKVLGYSPKQDDREVLQDWKERTTRICKPCWELKYCPYGPLVEQSPLLPSERQSIVEHREYMRKALATGRLGSIRNIDEAEKRELEKTLNDPELLLHRALFEVEQEDRIKACSQADDPVAAFQGRPLPPIEEYRIPYDVGLGPAPDLRRLPAQLRERMRKAIREDKAGLKKAIATGIYDQTTPMDPVRRAWFKEEVEQFDPEDYPKEIPQVFADASCNIFGHICPVFFAAESITETTEEKRRSSYIPFKTKMRIGRRENYTCQHCSKHLREDEVEFDHKIPLSRGGSSEEHNIRLTCFRCNRDKTNDVEV